MANVQKGRIQIKTTQKRLANAHIQMLGNYSSLGQMVKLCEKNKEIL